MSAGMTLCEVSASDVTVVIPVFNRFDVLMEAVASVLAQTRLPKEIVIVDDGSTEDSAGVKFTHPQVDIRVVRLPRNSGAPVARNAGVQTATGAWIAFLDADDLWEPTKLARQVEQIENSRDQFDAVATNIFMRRPGEPDVVVNPRSPRFNAELSLDLMVEDMALQTSTLMIKRSVMLQHPFDAELRRHQDWDLVLRLTSAGCRWSYLDEPLSAYRVDLDPRRISESKHRVEATKFWLKKQSVLVDPRAAAYYFSRNCLGTAIRKSVIDGLGFWLALASRSGPAFMYALMGLAAKIRYRTLQKLGVELLGVRKESEDVAHSKVRVLPPVGH